MTWGTLCSKNPAPRRRGDWDFAFTVRNLFDADAREPLPGLIANDLPLAPREWRFELRHQF